MPNFKPFPKMYEEMFINELNKTERFLLVCTIGCIIASIYLSITGPHSVNWDSFVLNYLVVFIFIFGGILCRIKRFFYIASVLIGTGIFIGFSNAGAKLNYLVGARSGESIDVWLSVLDAHLGFNWAAYANWFEQRPILTYALALIYQSAPLQMMSIIVILGFTGKLNRLNDFFAVGVMSSLISILIWSVWPSFGPTLLLTSPVLESRINLIIDNSYVEHLFSVKNGVPLEIDAQSLRGLIAFPSMHTVMLLMVLYYSRLTIFFNFFLILNIGMPFSILLHGGHHLMDVFGGMVVFLFILLILRMRDFFLVGQASDPVR